MVVTFLPYPNIKKSVKALDDQRLGKQRVEAFNILNAINGTKKGWRKHPATLMWKGFELCLKLYYNECISEWVGRGKNNNMTYYEINENEVIYPWWWGWEIFHQSHKCSLIRKAPWFYEEKFRDEIQPFMLEYGYIWPSKFTEEDMKLTFDRELAERYCDPINQGQLRPFCAQEGCKNRAKKLKTDDGEVVENYCGVHFRTYVKNVLNENKNKAKDRSKVEKKLESNKKVGNEKGGKKTQNGLNKSQIEFTPIWKNTRKQTRRNKSLEGRSTNSKRDL
ncbi:unnamed protein product [Blepharisma stoltei]|uniref:Uncharacterized protein n=1 Tax=Blepharisma stoltei TaxID=1481888 RepID=A0AAU9KND9_9CILI|nr:unnamed protein product [Blepharisma stoltei]